MEKCVRLGGIALFGSIACAARTIPPNNAGLTHCQRSAAGRAPDRLDPLSWTYLARRLLLVPLGTLVRVQILVSLSLFVFELESGMYGRIDGRARHVMRPVRTVAQ